MAKNPITSDDLTIDYKTLMRIPIGRRVDVVESFPQMANALSQLTPIQIAQAFPTYYKRQLPDISGFVSASNWLQKGLKFDQYGGGDEGTAQPYYDGEKKLNPNARPMNMPEPTLDEMRASLLQQGIDIEGITSSITEAGMLEGDPKIEALKGLSADKLAAMGFERFEDDTGKTYIRQAATETSKLTDEQVKEKIKEENVKPEGLYRPVYPISDIDLSPEVINTIAGEAHYNKESIDGVINNMINRVGAQKNWNNLHDVARDPGQYTGYRTATEEQAAFIKERMKVLSSGSEPSNVGRATEYRAEYYVTGEGKGKTFERQAKAQGYIQPGPRDNIFAETFPPGPFAPRSNEEVEKLKSERAAAVDGDYTPEQVKTWREKNEEKEKIARQTALAKEIYGKGSQMSSDAATNYEPTATQAPPVPKDFKKLSDYYMYLQQNYPEKIDVNSPMWDTVNPKLKEVREYLIASGAADQKGGYVNRDTLIAADTQLRMAAKYGLTYRPVTGGGGDDEHSANHGGGGRDTNYSIDIQYYDSQGKPVNFGDLPTEVKENLIRSSTAGGANRLGPAVNGYSAAFHTQADKQRENAIWGYTGNKEYTRASLEASPEGQRLASVFDQSVTTAGQINPEMLDELGLNEINKDEADQTIVQNQQTTTNKTVVQNQNTTKNIDTTTNVNQNTVTNTTVQTQAVNKQEVNNQTLLQQNNTTTTAEMQGPPKPKPTPTPTPTPYQYAGATPVSKYALGGTQYGLTEDLTVVDSKTGKPRFQVNENERMVKQGNKVEIIPETKQYADLKTQELDTANRNSIDEPQQDFRQDEPVREAPTKREPNKQESAGAPPEKTWRQDIRMVDIEPGSQSRAFARTKFREEGYHVGGRGSPNSRIG